MRFKIATRLDYVADAPVAILLHIRVQENASQKILNESFAVSVDVPHVLHTCDSSGNRFDKVNLEVPGAFHIAYEAEVEVTATRLIPDEIPETGPVDFDMQVLPYLYPSRYAESDRMGRISADLFDHVEGGAAKVQAVVDWIAEHISYVSGSTNSQTSAVSSLVERVGVCRDFAHLGIALCRAMNIPARYFSGYAHELQPPDFHACFETWLGGKWILWDPTGLASPDGVVRIGIGRDAADVSVCTAFGGLQLQNQTVTCEVLDNGYQKMNREEIRQTLISLESLD